LEKIIRIKVGFTFTQDMRTVIPTLGTFTNYGPAGYRTNFGKLLPGFELNLLKEGVRAGRETVGGTRNVGSSDVDPFGFGGDVATSVLHWMQDLFRGWKKPCDLLRKLQ
jgi:hypothetical protein